MTQSPLSCCLLSVVILAQGILFAAAQQQVGEDLFPVKAYPSYSKFWNVQYFNTYKIAFNLATNTSYLLYQNGTSPPSTTTSSSSKQQYDAVLEVPLLGNIALTETPTIPFLELLGVQTRIRAYLGSEAFISSPCLLERIDSGSVVISNASSASDLADTGLNATPLVAFVAPFDSVDAIQTVVEISEYAESSNAATFEWLKFYSLFFNLEQDANQIFNETVERAQCVEQNAAAVSADKPNRPVVLWGYYSDFCEGWSVGSCPNYYCEFAAACSATLLQSTEGSIHNCSATFMTLDEFTKFGRDADYWIVPSANWNAIYANYSQTLNQLKSVQNRQVFDYQGSGESAWFEERYAEYDVVTQDFCSIVGQLSATPFIHQRVWFRNVFTEAVGNLGTCSNVTAPLQSRATTCVAIPTTNSATSVAPASLIMGRNLGLLVQLFLLVIVTVV